MKERTIWMEFVTVNQGTQLRIYRNFAQLIKIKYIEDSIETTLIVGGRFRDLPLLPNYGKIYQI
jgi:hypothetical protein